MKCGKCGKDAIWMVVHPGGLDTNGEIVVLGPACNDHVPNGAEVVIPDPDWKPPADLVSTDDYKQVVDECGHVFMTDCGRVSCTRDKGHDGWHRELTIQANWCPPDGKHDKRPTENAVKEFWENVREGTH